MAAIPELSEKQCSNPDCRVASEGRCVEGIADLASCTHYGKPLVVVEGSKSGTTKTSNPRIPLSNAEALPRFAAEAMLRNRPSSVVAIVGPHDSGKTSLVGGIYDLLQGGRVGAYAFAGSSTLHSLERACHDSRSASKRADPHMERTERGDATYFHLELAREGGHFKRALLLGNRDGEAYMETQSDPDLAKAFPELRRCDTLTVLADGAKLLDSGERHQVHADVCLTLRAIKESGQTQLSQRVAIVLTKLDVVKQDAEGTARAIRHFDAIVADARSEFGHDFAEIEAFQVAASPKVSGAERGDGMPELLAFWMVVPQPVRATGPIQVIKSSVRAFGRLRAVNEESGRG